MAYGKKYFVEYKSSNNLDYYCEIWVEGQTAAAIQIEIGEGGPVIEYDTDKNDRFSPIISSSCRFPFLVKNFLFAQFIDNLRTLYKEKDVYLHLYRSPQSGHNLVAPLWSGFLLMDLSAGVDQSYPYEQELKFIDGLSLLKDIDFVKYPPGSPSGGGIPFEERTQGNYVRENMYYGPGTYIFWIREILQKVGSGLTTNGASQNYGFTTSVNWYNQENNSLSQSSDPLHLTKCQMTLFHSKDDQGTFYPDNCYNVLKNILKHWGARITYWKGEFWIVQIPEYITNESGTLDAPVNLNSRKYSNTGAFNGSQGHLGGTYWTRYEQEISTNTISKIVGTEYNYIAPIKKVTADFLSFSSKSIYGGFPFGATAPTQEIFQGSLNGPSNADFLWLSIPLDFVWDMTTSPLVAHTNGWWLAVKFNFYASNIDDQTGVITTYYLQYTSSSNTYYWVTEANWTPLGNKSPKYIIKSKSLSETNYVGFEQQIPFNDVNGASIVMDGLWSFFLDIEDFGTSNNNPGSFYCNFSGYVNPPKMRNPQNSITLPGSISSGTVTWSNTLEDQQGVTTININNPNPAGFNAGTSVDDYSLSTTSPFKGLLQLLSSTSSTAFGDSINLTIDNSNNTEEHSFGQLVWGDTISYAQSSLESYNGTIYVPTDSNGQWGRGILTGTSTFTEMLINEFLSGQTKVVINSSFRLAVGDSNKTQTVGLVSRPRYVNPIGKLRETTAPGTDPEYFFRRGKFYTALDEWDYEGYQIIRNSFVSTSSTNNIGNLGGSQLNLSSSSAPSQNPTLNALSQNSPIAYISQTVASTGANVSVNGNFNTAVGWSLGTGWSIDTTVNKAKFTATGSTSELTQSVLTEELTYQINFTVEVTAGSLLVKAGSSGTTETITSSGNYSIYLDCEGSSLIKFQASTTFTGNITHITIADQKSLSSVPIETIGTSVFKTGDTFNLINSNDSDTLNLTVTANQGSNDSTISVASTPLYEDIDTGSFLLINQDDLSEQYQNKTKGTVAGYGITATGIAKSGINITGWLNSDSMTGATVNNVPTALSVKNYVDGQVGASDTLAEVLANGNTTGGTDISVNDDDKITFGASGDLEIYHDQSNSYIKDNGVGSLRIRGTDLRLESTSLAHNFIICTESAGVALFYNDVQKLTTSNTGISITGGGTFSGSVDVNGNEITVGNNSSIFSENNIRFKSIGAAFIDHNTVSQSIKFRLSNSSSLDKIQFEITPNYAAFTDVPFVGTMAAGDNTTRAASTAFVANAVGSVDTLQEVTDNGNTTTNSIMIGSSSAPSQTLHVVGKGLFTDDIQLTQTTPRIDYGNTGASGALRFWSTNANSEKMRLTSDGNLGVGFTNPDKLIDIASSGTNTNAPTFRITNTANNNASNWNGKISHAIEFYSSDPSRVGLASSIQNIAGTDKGGVLTGNITFNTADWPSGGINERMRITDGGNVGINQQNPTEKLHVVGDALITGDSHADAFKPAVSGNPIKFKNFGSTEVGRFTDGGQLIVGNTAGFGIIHAYKSSSGVVGVTVQNGQEATNNGAAVYFKVAGSSSDYRKGGLIFVNNGTGYGRGDMYISLNTSTSGSSIADISSAKMIIRDTGKLNLPSYGSGTFTGAETYFLAVTSGGDVVEADSSALPGGPYLPLTGGTLTGALTGTTATFSSATDQILNLNSTDSNAVFMAFKRANTRIGYFGFSDTSSNVNIGNETTTGKIRFVTNSTTKMSLEANGNVLIGTTTDSGHKLSVAGTAKFGGQVTIPATPVATTDAASKSYVDAQVGSADTLSEVLALGNTSGANDIEMALGQKVYFNNNNENIFSNVNGDLQINARTELRIKGNNNNTNGVELSFFNGGSEKMRLLNNGNVLIGTTSDSGEKLQVLGNFKLEQTTNTNVEIKLNPYSSALGTSYAWNLVAGNSSNSYGFDIKKGTTSVFHINNLSNNNIGIGTTSPLTKLHINDGTNVNFKIGAASGELQIKSTNDADTAYTPIIFRANKYNILNGNFGINIVSPTEKLHVVGDALITGDSHADAFKPAVAANPIKFKNFGSTELARITDGGDLGIGISSPVSKINIATTKTVALDTTAKFLTLGLTIDDLNAGNTAGGGGGIAFRSKNTNSGTQMVFGAIDAVKEFATVSEFRGSLRFFTNQNSTGVPLERMRINSAGAIAFNGATNYGTSGQLLKSNANASPTWVDASSVIGGPYLPLTGGTLTGNLDMDAAINIKSGSAIHGTIKTSSNSLTLQARNTGIMLFQSGNSEKMRLTSGGNVGIGTSSPSARISLGTAQNNGIDFLYDTSNNYKSQIKTYWNSSTDTRMDFNIGRTSGVAPVTIMSVGYGNNVGIGTVSPKGKAHILDGTAANYTPNSEADTLVIESATPGGISIIGTGGGGLGKQKIIFGTTSDVDMAAIDYDPNNSFMRIGTTTTSNYLKFTSGNGVEGMRLTASSNLLLGTTTDNGAKLNVYKNNNVPLQVFGWSDRIGAANNANGSIYIGNNASYRGVIDYDASSTVNLIISNTYNNAAAGILFKTKTSGTANDVMILSGDGNVGIGTTSPDNILHIRKGDTGYESQVGADTMLILETTNISNSLQFSSTTSGNQYIMFGDDDPNSGWIAYSHSDNSLNFRANGSEKMRITSAGNVGIGTASPLAFDTTTTKLHIVNSGVSGTVSEVARFQGASDADGSGGIIRIGTSNDRGIYIEGGRLSSQGYGSLGVTAYDGTKTQSILLDYLGNTTLSGSLTGTTGQFTGIGVATTPSAVYKLDVNGKARVQSVLELDDVLTLNAISTPADPASGKSSIWMDTSGDIKVKINVSGTIVTRTIAAFE